MRRPMISRTAAWSIPAAALLALATVGPAISAQDSETPAKAPPDVKIKKFHPRLPNYYGTVVDEEQRQAIYDIQREYHPEIARLKAQLEALMEERNEKIEAP